jgi:acyl carrier protein
MEITFLPEDFDDKADLYSTLGVPSLKALEILMALEERYGISIPDEEFIQAVSLEHLIALIRKLKK